MAKLTDDEAAELSVLASAADTDGTLALEMYVKYKGPFVNEAFERGLHEGWYRMIDVKIVDNDPPHKLSRIFKLTAEGIARLDALRVKRASP